MEECIKKRYEFIDLLKAIAIFFVVIYHYNNLSINFLETQKQVSYLNYFFKSIFSTCVPIFFFLNGALLLNKNFNLKKHIYKLITIIFITVIWGIITLLILMPIKNEYMSLFEFVKSLVTWKPHWINHLWFLQALVVIYIFFPLIKKTYDSEVNNLYFFLIIAFIMTFGNVFLSNCANVLEFIIGKNYLRGNINFFDEFNAFRGIYGYSIVYFILGGLFFKYKEKFHEKKWVIRSISTIVISMVILTLYGVLMSKSNGEIYDIVWYGYDTIPTLFMVIALYILALKYKGNHKVFKLINITGKNSLGIYFMHMFWGSLFIKYFERFPYSHNIITNLLFALFVLLISLLSVLLLKKIPVVKKLFVL
ncbi:acyltransferase [Oceanirhabdus sp. W0125-5]|uniref:acyltransferase n=1 Tax=Oceanirhabdus sp. W0125-5 TaxID=2999116 RepID=UPI0022F2CAC6|nr:acyltransferase family protein [Oceanirhabdus sp. W0125-5]WBW98612.1 acyltransferase family protein [Oceanirhabdus sp. W0125-5]